MSNKVNYKCIYEARLPQGRKEFCPRVGIYKPLMVYHDRCYGRSALMMIAHWRPSLESYYIDDFVVVVQLESLLNNASPQRKKKLTDIALVGKEIIIHKAEIDEHTNKFIVRFELKEFKLNVRELNLMLKYGNPIIFDRAMQKWWRRYCF